MAKPLQPSVPSHLDRRPNDYKTRGTPAYGWTDEGRPIHAINDVGEPVCGRKINHEDALCQSQVLCANGRCNAKGHGGKNPGAPLKHGGRSAILKHIGFGQKFDRIRSDPEHRSHHNNIALYELAIENELEQGIPTGAEWDEACALYKRATKQGDAQALKELGPLLDEGATKQKRLERALEFADKQRKHKDSEAKRLAELESNLTAREATAFTMALATEVMDGFENLIKQVQIGVIITPEILKLARTRIAQAVAGRLR